MTTILLYALIGIVLGAIALFVFTGSILLALRLFGYTDKRHKKKHKQPPFAVRTLRTPNWYDQRKTIQAIEDFLKSDGSED